MQPADSLVPDDLQQLRQTVAAVLQEQARLRERIAALEERTGPRDAADLALLSVIATATHGLRFTAAALWRHRAVDQALADALEDADLDNARQVGKLLRRVAGREIAGIRIVRVGNSREGIRWSVRVCESGHRSW